MAFNNTNLSVLAYANGFSLFNYTTTDSSITSTGYFNDASSYIKTGDMILANVNGTADILSVSSSTDGVVTVLSIIPEVSEEA
ncbi:MAG: hypothetical protein R3Y43_02910 [Alphaproteobacteria bacterium]